MEVIQSTRSSDDIAGPSKPTPACVKKGNDSQPPLHAQTETPPNGRCMTPFEPVTMGQPTGLVIPSADAARPDQPLVESSDATDRESSRTHSTIMQLNDSAVAEDNEALHGDQSSAPQAQSEFKADTEDDKGTSAAPPRASVLGFKKVMETYESGCSCWL